MPYLLIYLVISIIILFKDSVMFSLLGRRYLLVALSLQGIVLRANIEKLKNFGHEILVLHDSVIAKVNSLHEFGLTQVLTQLFYTVCAQEHSREI